MPTMIAPTLEPAILQGASQFDIDSEASGRRYRVYLAPPMLPAPPSGYPVIYVLDGDSFFGTAQSQAFLAQFDGRPPALVVGIGYGVPDPMAVMVKRMHDLTPPAPPENIPAQISQSPLYAGATFGGAEAFFRFLTTELRPILAGLHPIDAANQTLFGDSLGGLFTLHALFNHPEAFRGYIAGSPSIWWNNRGVLAGEAGFKAAVEAGQVAPRILVTTGALEQIPPAQVPLGSTRESVDAAVAEARMVDNARELGQRLAGCRGGAGYKAAFHEFEGENHQTVIPATISRAVAFALAGIPSG